MIEKLYLMANTKLNLTAKEWYLLTTDVPLTGEGWLNNYIEKVKDRVQHSPELWQQYLAHVRELLGLKKYKINSIALALQFLLESKPANCHFF